MSLQDAYNEFASGVWADPDPEVCYCGGHGWALSDFDTWHKCPIHFEGQLCPEGCYDTYEEYEQLNAESMERWRKQREVLRCTTPLRNPAYDASEMGIFAEYGEEENNQQEECPECRDGLNFSPLDCSICGDALKKELADPVVETETLLPGWDDDIPF